MVLGVAGSNPVSHPTFQGRSEGFGVCVQGWPEGRSGRSWPRRNGVGSPTSSPSRTRVLASRGAGGRGLAGWQGEVRAHSGDAAAAHEDAQGLLDLRSRIDDEDPNPTLKSTIERVPSHAGCEGPADGNQDVVRASVRGAQEGVARRTPGCATSRGRRSKRGSREGEDGLAEHDPPPLAGSSASLPGGQPSPCIRHPTDGPRHRAGQVADPAPVPWSSFRRKLKLVSEEDRVDGAILTLVTGAPRSARQSGEAAAGTPDAEETESRWLRSSQDR